MGRSADNLVWMDMEMTGLDPATCVPLEIATVITDSDLNVLAEGPNLVIRQPASVMAAMDEWNTNQHGKSGLTESVLKSRVSLAQAEDMTLAFMTAWTEPGRSPLCGNSIGQDRRFLRRYMPRLEQHLHYRVIDISSIKELASRWYGIEAPAKGESHRALDDVHESLEELRFYRRTLFRSPPKPGDSKG
ncbi:MAG: oligoribonuclease [Myxococcota bacterium]